MMLRAYWLAARAVDAVTLAAVPAFAWWDRLAARAWTLVAVYAVRRAQAALDRLTGVAR